MIEFDINAQKQRQIFQIKILPPVKEILMFYKNGTNGTKYVFPIPLKDKVNPTQIENRKKKTLQQYNKEVKVLLSSVISISLFPAMPGNIKQKGISTDIISESMGHQNLAITQVYLKELDNSLVDEAMEVLL